MSGFIPIYFVQTHHMIVNSKFNAKLCPKHRYYPWIELWNIDNFVENPK